MPGTLFVNPMTLRAESVLYLVLPLCAAVAIVYKTIRVTHLRRFPKEVAILMLYMVVGLVGLGAALWLVQEYWP